MPGVELILTSFVVLFQELTLIRWLSAQVRVLDNGPGVSPQVRPRLFEPFVTGKPSGVGIGLALSRNIARAHGGELALQDGAAGATFVLTMPLSA